MGYGSAEEEMDFEALKKHEFFNGLNFEKIKQGKIAPPVPPQLKNREEESEDLASSGLYQSEYVDK